MVKRIYKRKTGLRRKKFVRKGRRVARIVRPRLPALGIPNTKMVRLRYAQQFLLSDSGLGDGLSDQQLIRANSLFDPDYSGVGHQPRYYDQYTPMYNHYLVLGSKIRVSGHMGVAGTSNISNGRLTVRLLDTVTTPDIPDSIIDLLESKNTVSIPIHNQAVGNATRWLTKTFSAKKFFGVKDMKDNHQLGAYYTANPTIDAWFNIVVMGASTGTLSTSYITVIIDYIALLTQVKNVADS